MTSRLRPGSSSGRASVSGAGSHRFRNIRSAYFLFSLELTRRGTERLDFMLDDKNLIVEKSLSLKINYNDLMLLIVRFIKSLFS